MFGKSIKSFNHLFRVVEDGVVYPSLIRTQGMTCVGFCLKKGNSLHLYNAFLKNIETKFNESNIYDMAVVYGSAYQVIYDPKNKKSMGDYERRLFNDFTLLDDSFIKKYTEEVSKKPFSECIRNIGCGYTNPRVVYLYAVTEGSRHLFQWAMSCVWKHRIDESTVRRTIVWCEKYPQLTKKLSKGTITAYSGFRQVMQLLSEQSNLRKEKRAADVINTFNTAQKKLFKDNILDDKETVAILSRFATLSKAKKENFIRKCSTIEDYKELILMLRHVTSSHFEWSKESFMDYMENVEGLDAKIVFEGEKCVLVQVNDYETIKRLGKMTNWCIGKNMSYWNQYVGKRNGAKQYMLFDFSKKEDDNLSIVGFTSVKNKGITNAHNFVNTDITSTNSNENVLLMQVLNSYASNLDIGTSIYTVLSKNNIDLSLVTEYEKAPYKWDRNSFIGFVERFIPEGFYRILMDRDGKLVMSINHENFWKIIGYTYEETFNSELSSYEHIVFADFNKNAFDNGRLSFTIIEPGGYNEDTPIGTYNVQCREIGGRSAFEALVRQFGLPYDIIRRTNNKYKRYKNEIQAYNVETLALVMSDKELYQKVDIDQDFMFELVRDSIFTYYSTEVLNAIYGSGKDLSSILSIRQVMTIFRDCVARFVNSLFRSSVPNYIPSVEDMEALEHREINRERVLDYIFTWKVMNMMIDHEPMEMLIENGIIKQLIKAAPFNVKVLDAIIIKLFERYKNTFMKNCMNSEVLRYIMSKGSQELKDVFAKVVPKTESAYYA